MLLAAVLALVAFAIGALTAPLNITYDPASSLIKRADPGISTSFSAQEVEQIKRGFNDVLKLVDTVLTKARDAREFDKIFVKYFNIKDRDFVLSVFNQILGGDKDYGNALLADISIMVDYQNAEGNWVCVTVDKGIITAQVREEDPKSPNLVLCKSALKYGAIDHPFQGVLDVNCNTLDPRVSFKMVTLGSILLHEYTHVMHLMKPVFKSMKVLKETATTDKKYGPVEVKRLATSKTDRALTNADSYAWLANEIFWTTHCSKRFESADAKRGDAKSPHNNS